MKLQIGAWARFDSERRDQVLPADSNGLETSPTKKCHSVRLTGRVPDFLHRWLTPSQAVTLGKVCSESRSLVLTGLPKDGDTFDPCTGDAGLDSPS